MKRVKFSIYTFMILSGLLISVCESKSLKEDTNDTNQTFAIPSRSFLQDNNEECVVLPVPDKITYRHIQKYPFGQNMDIQTVRKNISQDKTRHKYSLGMTIKTQTPNGAVINSSLEEKISEYYTISKDRLYIDMTKQISKGLRTINLSDPKSGKWGKSTRLPSDKGTIRASTGTLHKFDHENRVIMTYTPYRRIFAKYCKHRSFSQMFTVLTDSGGKIAEKRHNVSYVVKSINEQKTVKAGTFSTVRVEKIDNGHASTDWYDTKTGLWVYHEGDDGTMELQSYKLQ